MEARQATALISLKKVYSIIMQVSRSPIGVDFIPLTDVFTMMPNPAQTYTQINFGDEYIAKEKTIEVYNAMHL